MNRITCTNSLTMYADNKYNVCASKSEARISSMLNSIDELHNNLSEFKKHIKDAKTGNIKDDMGETIKFDPIEIKKTVNSIIAEFNNSYETIYQLNEVRNNF